MAISTSQLIRQQKERIVEISAARDRLLAKPRSSFNVNVVHNRSEALLGVLNEARATHREILSREDDCVDAYVDEKVFANLQAVYEEAEDFLMEVLAEIDKSSEQAPSDSDWTEGLDGRATPSRNPPATPQLYAKMPRIDLPKFSGEYTDWEYFSDMFKSLVHDVPHMPDSAKLIQLRSCMQGSAVHILKGMSLTKTTYAEVWQALQERFQNPRFTVYHELQCLMDVPVIKEESADQLRYFTDEVQRIIRVLSNLKMPVAHWDVWIVFVLASRLDPESQRAWETQLNSKDLPNRLAGGVEDPMQGFPRFDEFSLFLEQRARTLCMLSLEKTQGRSKSGYSSAKPVPGTKRSHHAAFSSEGTSKCPLCASSHFLAKCANFLDKTPFDRREVVRKSGLCFNCFGDHPFRNCKSKGRCRQCHGKHHSLIHYNSNKRSTGNNDDPKPSNPAARAATRQVHHARIDGSTLVNACGISNGNRIVLLATAQIDIIGPRGNRTQARALLDQGSEASFVSETLVQRAGLSKRSVQMLLSGVGGCQAGSSNSATYFTVQSLADPRFTLEMDAFVLPKVTSDLPVESVVDLDLARVKNLVLADPQFNLTGAIDLLIGADFYGQLLRDGLKKLAGMQLIAQNTALGWVMSGPVEHEPSRRAAPYAPRTLHCRTANWDESLQRFWVLEEVPSAIQKLKPQDEICEKMFVDTHSRDKNGRYVVRLPFKETLPSVAVETRRMALGSLNHTRRRLDRDARLDRAYRDFMEEYIKLKHMTPVPANKVASERAWYLPHHAVVQTTPKYKIRVVFDASRRTSEKQSLNDFLMAGPPLQRDLALILLNWRRYRYVFTADIIKMFRQIRVTPDDQDLLRVVWPPEAPKDWSLATVTYGTTCAPYLAIRTLMQLAADEKSRFPLASDCLESNTYVDDIFAGADELSLAMKKRDELISMLRSAGIELDKWAASPRELLPNPTTAVDSGPTKVLDRESSIKTLGVLWNPKEDCFGFSVADLDTDNLKITKRYVLSDTARLFDPLGWLAPVTVVAKILMQDLWILKCGWDDLLPDETRDRWLEYRRSLASLPKVSLQRWIESSRDSSLALHGFSDASKRAYAAVVYLRTTDNNGKVSVSILSAKTKVSPVKTVSIPNLELCGATLLVRLVKHLQTLEFLKHAPVHLWTDSEIVLTWLNKHPSHWKTFVANRVSLIQTELPSASWSHVPTKTNPADLATRGVLSSELKERDHIWWCGPSWLSLSPNNWPQNPRTPTNVLHIRAPVQGDEFELLRNYSSLSKLVRVTAYCLRFYENLRRCKTGLNPVRTTLTVSELDRAQKTLIRAAQSHAYTREIHLLQLGRPLPKGNGLRKLYPIVSKVDGLLCVGGRLTNSLLSYDRKHPPILPRHSALSVLFVRWAHRAALHGGATLTTNLLIQRVWILGMRPLVKTAIRNCITCQRHKPRLAQQLMGDLPAARVTPSRPFTNTGLDYAGPIDVRTSKGRGQRSYKGYIALFICFATKAIHLELVSDLTTKSFIAAFRRFVSRRGVCRNLYSDNATNFRGADTELKAMFHAASEFYKSTASTFAANGTNWTFIPPNTPHYGGLWEAGVKSVKHLLKRSLGDHTLTFEELTTVLAEIEACLNSRPLCPLSADPEDLGVLTPAHFLLGAASALIPDEEPPAVPENRLDRFQLMQRKQTQFWKQWSSDYLHHLQERNKWRTPTKNYGVGQLVLVMDDRYPPSKWALGRVIEGHPGKDNLIRVVTVKTATSTYRRHISRLAPLSLDDAGPSATQD